MVQENRPDRFGIKACVSLVPFEAAWSIDGAVCVAHPRIPELATLKALAEKYPRLTTHLGNTACTWETAEKDPTVLIYNGSAE